jgi:hypothetical protein
MESINRRTGSEGEIAETDPAPQGNAFDLSDAGGRSTVQVYIQRRM